MYRDGAGGEEGKDLCAVSVIVRQKKAPAMWGLISGILGKCLDRLKWGAVSYLCLRERPGSDRKDISSVCYWCQSCPFSVALS